MFSIDWEEGGDWRSSQMVKVAAAQLEYAKPFVSGAEEANLAMNRYNDNALGVFFVSGAVAHLWMIPFRDSRGITCKSLMNRPA